MERMLGKAEGEFVQLVMLAKSKFSARKAAHDRLGHDIARKPARHREHPLSRGRLLSIVENIPAASGGPAPLVNEVIAGALTLCGDRWAPVSMIRWGIVSQRRRTVRFRYMMLVGRPPRGRPYEPSDIERVVTLPLRQMRTIRVPLGPLHLQIGIGKFFAEHLLQLCVVVEVPKGIEQIER